MVITLTDLKGSGKKDDVKLYIPINPEKISCKCAGYFQEYNIINIGAAKIPAGEDITTISWESFFPGNRLKNQQYVGKYTKPTSIHNRLESWRKNGTKLKLNITGTPFTNIWVYIESYEPQISDAHGSIYYSIQFSKAITVSVEKVAKKKSKNKTTGTKRTTKKTKKYTVKSGDCLWNIAVKYYKSGVQWKKIYNANKTTIENAAKKRGFKNSNNGNRIWPGTVLKIP